MTEEVQKKKPIHQDNQTCHLTNLQYVDKKDKKDKNCDWWHSGMHLSQERTVQQREHMRLHTDTDEKVDDKKTRDENGMCINCNVYKPSLYCGWAAFCREQVVALHRIRSFMNLQA